MSHDPAPRDSEPPLFARRLMAISGSLATVIFLVLGFALGAWAVAWVVFLIPPLVHRWYSVQDRHGYGQITENTKPYPYKPGDQQEGDEPKER